MRTQGPTSANQAQQPRESDVGSPPRDWSDLGLRVLTEALRRLTKKPHSRESESASPDADQDRREGGA